MLDPNIAKLGYDVAFGLDDFGKPLLKSEAALMKNVILFVLFSRPGQYPSLPNIGLDIQSLLYSFYDEIDNNDLKAKIIAQCTALGTYFDSNNIIVRKIIYRNKPSLMIHIEGTDTTLPTGYTVKSDTEKYQIGITFDELDQMIYNISA